MAGIDLETLKIHDLGDLHVAGDVEETLRRLSLVVKEILESNKFPVLIGGEHTITLGALRALRGVYPESEIAIISLDAHLDMRDEYMGQRLCHATFMRRVNEEIKPKIIEVGTRAFCLEELKYARSNGIKLITVTEIMENDVEDIIEKIATLVGDSEILYLTIDMDVLDPAFAPAVQNPEPNGISMYQLITLVSGICSLQVSALDLVEVAPNYDSGITALGASRLIFEALCHIEKFKRSK